ncbi:MAG: hypothetical protein K5894_15680 [Lachnospiraceae bacterium]|nr:hypothetical protein [Lachnospiraceae bacterium]
MQDMAPDIYKKLKAAFDKKRISDKSLKEISEIIDSGKGRYKDADDYAVKLGELLGEAFSENLNAESLPDGKLYYNIANRTVTPMLKENHSAVAGKCEAVQKALNEVEKLGLRAIVPELGEKYIMNIINVVTEMDDPVKITEYP